MTPSRTFAVAGRVLLQLVHDPRSVALLLIAPPLLVGLFAFGLIAVLQAMFTVTYAIVVCGLTTEKPVWQLGLVAVLDALLGTALGLLASAFARTEFQAVQFMPLVVIPQILFGGLLMPRDQMPAVLTAVSDWLPLSYVVDAVNAVTAGTSGWDLSKPLIVIATVALVALALAAVTLRRRTPLLRSISVGAGRREYRSGEVVGRATGEERHRLKACA